MKREDGDYHVKLHLVIAYAQLFIISIIIVIVFISIIIFIISTPSSSISSS